MSKFTSSENKDYIRRHWGKLLLEFLHNELECKLVYMGLPSPEARDIKEWLQFIDKVIAFQCRNYPNPSDKSQNRDAIIELENLLSEYERRSLITTYNVFDGYLEEVVLRGRDNSKVPFEQSESIMVYNLDFCNSIDSPLEYINEDGEPVKAFKFQVINELLRMQKTVNTEKFIMFLTIKTNYDDAQLRGFMNLESNGIANVVKSFFYLKGKPMKSRVLRAFVISTLKNFFQVHHYIPHFLPTIQYKGTSNANLLHFTIFGTKGKINANGLTDWNQNFPQLCNQKFVTILNHTFGNSQVIPGLNESPAGVNPVESFKRSKTFKENWENSFNEK